VNISIVPHILRAIDMPVTIHYSAALVVSPLIGGAVVTMIASVSPALSSSRLNIIEAVKYE
jgi:putative ABC transport system permease protein